METVVLDTLMEGAVDMHLHSNPDIIARKLSDIELAKAAKEAHMAGIMLKCHYGLTAARAALVMECVHGISVFGGIVLNTMVGGLNPEAVETALKLGAKEVWMPTITSKNHLKSNGKDISKAVRILDDKGNIMPSLYPILEMIAKADVILVTGHLSVDESLKVIALAKQIGVKKILVTHPEWEFTLMPVKIQKQLASQGVFFERCYYAVNSAQQFPIQEIARQISVVGLETTIISTDFGQPSNDYPVVGLRKYMAGLLANGLSPRDIEIIAKKNPKALLDMF